MEAEQRISGLQGLKASEGKNNQSTPDPLPEHPGNIKVPRFQDSLGNESSGRKDPRYGCRALWDMQV